MKLLVLKITATVMLTLGLVVGTFSFAMADDRKQESTQSDDAIHSSTDIQERGLSLSPGAVPRAQVARPPAPFKCSAATLTCQCFGVSDCNWMRRLIGDKCFISDSCTQNCECKISK